MTKNQTSGVSKLSREEYFPDGPEPNYVMTEIIRCPGTNIFMNRRKEKYIAGWT